ncbi:MAG: hypothetical protein WA900_04885 [Casimicrobiaceae bacterium]
MNAKLSVSAAIAVFLVAGCGGPGHYRPAPPGREGAHVACAGGGAPCSVKVTVTDNCQIVVDERIDVTGKNVNIMWEIDGPSSYTFAEGNGVFIKPNDNPPDQIVRPTQPQNGRLYILHDKNSIKGATYTYPYGVQLMNGSTACPVYDPWIVNRR